jgi:hypothetical protein
MEFKGTQGKWIIKGDSITDENGFSIANVEYPYRIDVEWGEKGARHWNQKGFHLYVSEEEASANEKLISKAPEMLEMLQYFVENNMLSVTGEEMAKQLIKEATTV